MASGAVLASFAEKGVAGMSSACAHESRRGPDGWDGLWIRGAVFA